MRPWNKLKITECNDPLVPVPFSIDRLLPHPYVSLGAPYGDDGDPWRLRSNVIRRLLLAQEYLSLRNNQVKLALFDAWRPIPVQAFMVNYVIEERCKLMGISASSSDSNKSHFNKIVDDVNKFWASPSLDPSSPPPHSTGAAVDLTLVGPNGLPLNFGGEIDEIGSISEPNYYADFGSSQSSDSFKLFHSRRTLLSSVMKQAGFVQHPNEWWHFSFGDQLWAWQNNFIEAIYGALPT